MNTVRILCLVVFFVSVAVAQAQAFNVQICSYDGLDSEKDYIRPIGPLPRLSCGVFAVRPKLTAVPR